MKLKRVLASILCFAMVLSTMCFSVSAESEYVLGEADFETNDGVVFDGTNYYDSLADAVKAVHAIDDAILYCKPGADLGAMTHGHVCKNLTVFGNSAYLSGGEQDFEIDFPAASGNPCSGLTGDVTLTVDNLTGAGAWGSRTSEYDVNLVFTNCESMGKVFYMGTSGEVNITMTDCTFTSNDISNCKVYTNAAGVITLTNVDFSGIEQPVALGNNSAGTQTIVLADCDFVDCGATTQDWTVPVSVKSKNVDGSSVLTVKDCTFTGTNTNSIGQDADILLDYGVGKTTATIVNTTAKVGVETEANVADYAEVNADDSVIMTNESAATLNPVAEINGTYYASVQAAVDSAVVGDNEIQLLPGTIDENVFILQQAGKNIIIKGSADVLYTGGFEICGNNRGWNSGAQETLTFEGINFNGEDYTVAHDFIGSTRKNTLPSGTLVWAYPHNVTVKNCNFVGNWDGETDYNTAVGSANVVAIRNVGGYNWTVENCTATGLHSFMQSSANTLTSKIDNITVTKATSGLNLGTNSNYTITNSTFDVLEFAIRADANSDRDVDLTIKNNVIKGENALIVRKADSANFTYGVIVNENKIICSGADIVRLNGADTDTISFNYGYNYWGGDAAVIDGVSESKIVDSFAYYVDKDMTVVGGCEAKIGDEYYETLADAIDEAQNGDVIDLMGNTIEINVYQDSYHKGKSLTFKNGTLDFSYAGAPTALFWLSGNQKLAFEDVNIIKRDVGTERKFMYNLIQIASPTASVSFKDCTIDLDGAYDETNAVGMYSSYIANDGNGTIYFENCDIETEYTNFIYRGGATVINCTYNGFADLDDGDIAGNFILWSANPCVIKNSTINTRQLGFISANGTIAITEDSYVYAERVRHYYAADNANYTEGLLTIDASSTLEAVELDMGLINENSEGVINTEASKVYVQYKKVDVDANGNDTIEDQDKYEIVLVGANNNAGKELINELASADLTFEFVGTPVTGGAMDYFVEPANGVSLTQLGDRYMFNYNGVDKYEETGAAIVIGTITIDGYGSYNLGTKEVTTNAVYATEIKDNIVDGFTPAAGLEINKDVFADDGMVGNITDGEIAVPTRTLKVTIDFPNAIEANVADYQDMKVEITGTFDGVNKTVTYDLGEVMVDGSYVVEDANLVLNNAYTVTVSGAGYRTARYTVTMTEDKALRFWNNVMDENQVVELGKDSSIAKVTFLAGDIVKDNNINIYDLSAVVSYFGQTNDTTAYSNYAKYDLNRDGVIDSKDVAYVLVSWNN